MAYAHIRAEDGEKQNLTTHLLETAELAGKNGAVINLETTCYLAGLLHDVGKYTSLFQDYLQKAVKDPKSVKKGSVDHSTYGGKILWDLKTPRTQPTIEILANSIFSHHASSGLLDFVEGDEEKTVDSNFYKRLEKDLPEYEEVKRCFFKEVMSEEKLKIKLAESAEELTHIFSIDPQATNLFFLTKFIYSCLLDGDRKNTYLFELGKEKEELPLDDFFQEAQENLEELFSSFENRLQDVPVENQQEKAYQINVLRQKMANICLEKARNKTDIYRLSIPTGGGKTLSSLRFALNHSLDKGKRKIIYIIPFTSIIEQNAEETRKVLKNNDYILEHHSNLMYEEKEQSEEEERQQALLQDNWESPIIFTTMVRFLEVAFSGGTRNPRRFHQLTNAVLIFDEIQSLPLRTTTLFIRLLKFLRDLGQTTSILCTATQPELGQLPVSLDVAAENELIPDLSETFSLFQRVRLINQVKLGGHSEEDIQHLAEDILKREKSLLVVLNTKSRVQKVYQLLKETPDVKIFHLSNNMCPAHRKKVLVDLKEALENGSQKVLCITTPLIEAGVDISFASVIRATASLASIAQAAGRCNRNGESEKLQPVYIINVKDDEKSLKQLPEILKAKDVTEQLLFDATGEVNDLLQPTKMRLFFTRYYQDMNKTHLFDYPFGSQKDQYLAHLFSVNKNRWSKFQQRFPQRILNLHQSPQTIAKNFEVIAGGMASVLVPYEAGEGVIAAFNGEMAATDLKKWYQKAQSYSVNLPQSALQRLLKEDLVQPIFNGELYALKETAYDKEYGLNYAGSSEFSFYNF